jgi:hypothetical protein
MRWRAIYAAGALYASAFSALLQAIPTEGATRMYVTPKVSRVSDRPHVRHIAKLAIVATPNGKTKAVKL